MRTMTVFVVSETPNEAMVAAERGDFHLLDPTRAMSSEQTWKVWAVELEVVALSAVTRNPKAKRP